MSDRVKIITRRVGDYLNIEMEAMDISKDLGLFDTVELENIRDDFQDAIDDINQFLDN